MKKKFFFLCFLSVFALINIIPLFVFKDYVGFSKESYFSSFAMIVLSLNGILSYFFRHKNNYLSFGTPRGGVLWKEDKDFTFSKEYKREFYWQFLVYWLTIPFYIPCIFFSTKPIHSLWTLCLIFLPQTIFIVYGILNTLKDVKEYKLRQQKLEQELKKQQEREEMGRFK